MPRVKAGEPRPDQRGGRGLGGGDPELANMAGSVTIHRQQAAWQAKKQKPGFKCPQGRLPPRLPPAQPHSFSSLMGRPSPRWREGSRGIWQRCPGHRVERLGPWLSRGGSGKGPVNMHTPALGIYRGRFPHARDGASGTHLPFSPQGRGGRPGHGGHGDQPPLGSPVITPVGGAEPPELLICHKSRLGFSCPISHFF